MMMMKLNFKIIVKNIISKIETCAKLPRLFCIYLSRDFSHLPCAAFRSKHIYHRGTGIFERKIFHMSGKPLLILKKQHKNNKPIITM